MHTIRGYQRLMIFIIKLHTNTAKWVLPLLLQRILFLKINGTINYSKRQTGALHNLLPPSAEDRRKH